MMKMISTRVVENEKTSLMHSFWIVLYVSLFRSNYVSHLTHHTFKSPFKFHQIQTLLQKTRSDMPSFSLSLSHLGQFTPVHCINFRIVLAINVLLPAHLENLLRHREACQRAELGLHHGNKLLVVSDHDQLKVPLR